MPINFPNCINNRERWGNYPRQMETSCSPAKIDGKLINPCTNCRLTLEKIVDSEGREIQVDYFPVRRERVS